MIFSAHRVISPDGTVGINCFQYVQHVQQDPVKRFFEDGVLVWQDVTVGEGARLVSFVDIALPEDVPRDEIAAAFEKLMRLEDVPATYRPGGSPVAFRLDVHPNLVPHWRREVASLVQHLMHALP